MAIDKRTRKALGLLALVAAGWISYRGAVAVSGPSFASVADAHRDRVEAQLRHLPAIASQVKALPPLSEDRVVHAGPPLVMKNGRDATVMIMHAEDLAVTDQLGFVPRRLAPGTMNECAALVRLGHTPIDPASPDEDLSVPDAWFAGLAFERCEAARTLLVVRTTEYLAPTVALAADAGFEPDLTICAGGQDAGRVPPSPEERYVFAGGEIKAEVLVFDLQIEHAEGGYRVQVRSQPRLGSTRTATELADLLVPAVCDGLMQYVPGSRVER